MPEHEWEQWPVLDTSTFFFRVRLDALMNLELPEGLKLYRDGDYGEIEVGYVRFSGGPTAKRHIGETHELSWGVRVQAEKGATFAFLQKNLSADNMAFVDDATAEGFCTPGTTFNFTIAADGLSIQVRDDYGPIVDLRRPVAGHVSLPEALAAVALGESDVWTQQPNQPLYYRKFRWNGPARVKLAPDGACTLHPHPFFLKFDPQGAEPIPTQIFSAYLEDGQAHESYQEFWLHPEQVG